MHVGGYSCIRNYSRTPSTSGTVRDSALRPCALGKCRGKDRQKARKEHTLSLLREDICCKSRFVLIVAHLG